MNPIDRRLLQVLASGPLTIGRAIYLASLPDESLRRVKFLIKAHLVTRLSETRLEITDAGRAALEAREMTDATV